MGSMKIIGYMNLTPDQIELDTAKGTVGLAESGRGWQEEVYPSVEAAAQEAGADRHTYKVTAEVPDGSVFEVRGDIDQAEGRRGLYTAGYFDNFAAAFEASKGLGVMGRRGEVTILPAPMNVFSTVEEWKAETALRPARDSDPARRTELRAIVQLAPHDPKALGAADPEYAIWIKLNAKYGQAAGARA